MKKLIPGTTKPFKGPNPFEEFSNIIELTDGLSLGQICSLSGLDPSVIQNWVKRLYVAKPIKKKYYDKQVARILLINSLKEAMRIEDIGKLLGLVNGDVEDESDDLLSEADLYNLFANSIYHLKNEDTHKAIEEAMLSKYKKNEKLFMALEVMVNAYLASEYKKLAKSYLKKLEEY